MTNDELKDIFNTQLSEFFGPLNRRLDELEVKIDQKADSDRLYSMLDGLAQRLETDDHERTAMQAQLDRHERWHAEAATKLGLRLEP